MPAGRKRSPYQPVFLRIATGDKQLAQALADDSQTTLSDILRQWISAMARAERLRHDNQKAVDLMQQFFGSLQSEIAQVNEGAAELMKGLKAGGRPSNTGRSVSKMKQTPVPPLGVSRSGKGGRRS